MTDSPDVIYHETPQGDCVCGHLAYTTINGQPMHPCCHREGPGCMPCAISRDAERRRRQRQPRPRAKPRKKV